MIVRGDYYVRDPPGTSCVPCGAKNRCSSRGNGCPPGTGGRASFLPCSNSYAAKHVGRTLRPGEMVFVEIVAGDR